jgi:hypothetical protein
MMTPEVPEIFGVTRLSEYGISHLSDNVVLLQFVLDESSVKRAISIMKTRGRAHDSHICQFEITSDGFVLGEDFLPTQRTARNTSQLALIEPAVQGQVDRAVRRLMGVVANSEGPLIIAGAWPRRTWLTGRR